MYSSKSYENNDKEIDKKTCTCVPSGRCHSNTLIGCPHQHYYNDKNIWTCGINPKDNYTDFTLDRSYDGKYVVRKK